MNLYYTFSLNRFSLKDEIVKQINKMQYAVLAMEKCREKMDNYRRNIVSTALSSIIPTPFDILTIVPKPNPFYWPQPKLIPRVWYKIYNVERIVMQLFTPKMPLLSYLDVKENVIRIKRKPEVDMVSGMLIPLPDKDKETNDVKDISVSVIGSPASDKQELIVPKEQAT